MTFSTSATEHLDGRLAPDASAGSFRRRWAGRDLAPLPVCLLAAGLCLTIAVIHIQDQGGFLGNVTPEWIAIGYYAVEAVAAITALLFARQQAVAWLLGLAVSGGPFGAYVLSRSVGLPGDSADIGNWGYVLGMVSLIVEGALFVLCAIVILRALTRQRARVEHRRADLAITT
jgi:hypothetical protein